MIRTEDSADFEQRLDAIAPRSPRVDANSIGGFVVTYNDSTLGTSVAFTLASTNGISSLQLKRNFSLDPGSAIVLQSWDTGGLTAGQQLKYDDNDPSLRANQSIYYWIDCIAYQVPESNITVGPQTFTNNADTLAPDAILDFDASHEAVSGGTVLVSASFSPPLNGRFGSCKIYVTGYNGIAASQALAQNATSPWRFTMLQTGETVTLTAIAVSLSGIEAATGPTKSLALGSAATVPAKIIGATATELTTGVQVTFPAGAESNITVYSIYRGKKGAGFGAAGSIGTVVPSGSFRYTFLDTGGLAGVFEWYVIATNAIGNSSASAAINTIQLNTTADVPVVNSAVGFTASGILTQSGVTTLILVASSTAQYGFGQVNYSSGSVDPGVLGTWYVYADDPLYAGGAVTYVASATKTVPVAGNGRVSFGSVTTVGGGGGSGGGGGCVEKGTPVEFYPDSEVSEEEMECSEWVELQTSDDVLAMHPDTLVSVFKKAIELRPGDLLEGKDGAIIPCPSPRLVVRDGIKIKRTVKPSRVYFARGVRLHNNKVPP